MTGNLFGHLLRVMSFGESHGPAMGVVFDGMPSGVEVEYDLLENFLMRRRPGQTAITSSRNEKDAAEILSGVFENKTLGTPLAVMIKNQDARSKDYKDLKPRKGHADEVWLQKYKHVDLRGGGRSSGRETVSRVIAGAFAKMALQSVAPDMEVISFNSSIGPVDFGSFTREELIKNWHRGKGFNNDLCVCENEHTQDKLKHVRSLLLDAKEKGESYGGVVSLLVTSPLKSLGQPVFGKVKSALSSALMSVGAVNGVEFGAGFEATQQKGTDFHGGDHSVYGGIQGGITTGEDIDLKVSVKPTSSIMDVAKKGRHDPCITPRICVVLESMIWIVLLDLFLQRKSEI